MIEHRTLCFTKAGVDYGISAHLPCALPNLHQNFFSGRIWEKRKRLAQIILDLANHDIGALYVPSKYGNRGLSRNIHALVLGTRRVKR